jgi:hypothetical protein
LNTYTPACLYSRRKSPDFRDTLAELSCGSWRGSIGVTPFDGRELAFQFLSERFETPLRDVVAGLASQAARLTEPSIELFLVAYHGGLRFCPPLYTSK